MVPTTLGPEDRRVYEFVVRRFLACCSTDATGETTDVEMDYGGEAFATHGLLVKERNYLDVYPYDRWESSQQLPSFAVGDVFAPTEAAMAEGQTTAPGYLTEPELIALMDANGIGTDATMAEHIARINEREYVTARPRRGATTGPAPGAAPGAGRGRGRGGGGATGGVQEFIPTTLGVALMEGYDQVGLETSLSKPFLRKAMEAQMAAICAGTRSKHDVVHQNVEQYRAVFQRTAQHIDVLKAVSAWPWPWPAPSKSGGRRTTRDRRRTLTALQAVRKYLPG